MEIDLARFRSYRAAEPFELFCAIASPIVGFGIVYLLIKHGVAAGIKLSKQDKMEK